MDCNLPGSSVHGIFQARVLEWGAIWSQQTVFQDMGIPDHLICLLRNLYVGQEGTFRTWHGTTDWFQTGKRVCQGCILSPCWFNWYTEYIVWHVKLDEAQAGIKIAGRNINNLRYTDDTTLMAESEELKSRLTKAKEEVKKHGIHFHHFMANRWKTMETVTDFYFLGLQNHCRWWLQPWN